jgi:predicted DCC family thiol-disulfide oxidoreductase YuxK
MQTVNLLQDLVARKHPARPAVLFRVLIGLCHLWKIGVYWPVSGQMLQSHTFRATWSGIEPINEQTRPWIFALWLLSALCLIAGIRLRITGMVCALSIWCLILTDQQLYSNHLYLLSWATVFVACMNAGNRRDSVPYWPVLLVCFLISNLYFFSGLSKLNPEFVSGAVIRHHAYVPYLNIPLPGAQAAAWFTLFLEFTLPFALWIRRLQPWAFLGGFLLHAGIVLTMEPRQNLVVFSTVMLGSYLLFLDARPASRLVVWDDLCGFCAGWARLFRKLDWLGVLRFEGSSDTRLLDAHGITPEEADAGLQFVYRGERRSGYDAVVAVFDALPLSFLWSAALRIPPVPQIGRRIYARVAQNRRCILPPPPVPQA